MSSHQFDRPSHPLLLDRRRTLPDLLHLSRDLPTLLLQLCADLLRDRPGQGVLCPRRLMPDRPPFSHRRHGLPRRNFLRFTCRSQLRSLPSAMANQLSLAARHLHHRLPMLSGPAQSHHTRQHCQASRSLRTHRPPCSGSSMMLSISCRQWLFDQPRLRPSRHLSLETHLARLAVRTECPSHLSSGRGTSSSRLPPTFRSLRMQRRKLASRPANTCHCSSNFNSSSSSAHPSSTRSTCSTSRWVSLVIAARRFSHSQSASPYQALDTSRHCSLVARCDNSLPLLSRILARPSCAQQATSLRLHRQRWSSRDEAPARWYTHRLPR